jgi:GT2 family glycosyltransferase
MRSVEVVIVTRNSAGHIGPCVESILAQGGLPIVVDNGSADATLEIVREKCPEARIVATKENLGYGKAINLGFHKTKGEIVILSNPDVVYLAGAIPRMVEFLNTNARVGCVGPQQIFPDGNWQKSYGDLPGIWPGIKDAVGITTLHNRIRRALWPRRIDRKAKEVPYVDGGVLVVRRQAFEQMGGFDEAFYFYSDESDLCGRLKEAGWKVFFFPSAKVIHVRGADSARVDRSDRFVRYMVNSQCLLANRRLPPWQAQLYAKLQICHFVRLWWMARLLRLFSKEASLEYKVWFFGTYVRIWKEAAIAAR